MFSIITPCLNRAAFVAKAVHSVLQQNAEVEHIIMDGGSTDGSLDVLGRFQSLRIFSQPDKGIYDALNKGIRLAQGDVIGFLNTDDLYEPGTLASINQLLNAHPEVDAVVGGASIFYEDAGGKQVMVKKFGCIPQQKLLERATQGAPVFNAWFFRKRLLKELNGFDTQYLYAADRDLLIRMAIAKKPYWSLDQSVYRYRMHPGSYTLSGKDSGEAAYMFETRALAERYLRMPGMLGEESRHFRVWHSQITMEHIRSAWRARAFRRMAGYMLVGYRFDACWPLFFTRKVIERLPYILGQRTDS